MKSERHETTTPNPSLEEEGRKNTTPLRQESETHFIKRDFSAWQFAWELGYTIAIPIVVLALVGRWADKAWGTSPWMLLAGIVLSIIISSALVYRKVKKIL